MKYVLTVFVFFMSLGVVLTTDASESRPAPDLKAGKASYNMNCARCHGIEGKGDGPDAKRLYPRPRDVASGVFKFRSTPSGSPPTDDDLFQTVANGLPGSRMPDFRRLSDEDRWQLVYYVKTFSSVFDQPAPLPVSLGQDPGPKGVNLAKGQQVYTTLGCAACHGQTGRGNGPSAMTLVDNWDQPIRAADLTHGWNYRGGREPRDILMRVMSGIDGAPMPSYAEAVTPEDGWHLASYVHSLQEEPTWKEVVEAIAAKGPLPTSLTDPQWTTIERTDVRMGSLIYRQGQVAPTTVEAISVQAVHDQNTLALRLVWHDPTENRTAPSDAVALVLKPEGATGDIGNLQTWPMPGSPSLDLCYWLAASGQAQEALAKGFPPAPEALLASDASYEDGRWTVVIRRPLTLEAAPGAVVLAPHQRVPLAFAAWDGGNDEQGRKRSVSSWMELILQ